MAISDRTRKLLWGRAGSRCAICRRPLVAEPVHADDREAVLGEECHIVGRRPAAPRASEITASEPDEYSNLILLCRDDHKRVDDQPGYYTSKKLREVKQAHERWVDEALDPKPEFLWTLPRGGKVEVRVALSGHALFAITSRGLAYEFDHAEPQSAEEAEVMADFLQDVQDFGDIWEEIGPGGRVREEYAMTERLRDLLQEHQLLVYAGEYTSTWQFGSKKTRCPVAVVRIERLSDVVRKLQAASDSDEVRTADVRLVTEIMAKQIADEMGVVGDSTVSSAHVASPA